MGRESFEMAEANFEASKTEHEAVKQRIVENKELADRFFSEQFDKAHAEGKWKPNLLWERFLGDFEQAGIDMKDAIDFARTWLKKVDAEDSLKGEMFMAHQEAETEDAARERAKQEKDKSAEA